MIITPGIHALLQFPPLEGGQWQNKWNVTSWIRLQGGFGFHCVCPLLLDLLLATSEGM